MRCKVTFDEPYSVIQEMEDKFYYGTFICFDDFLEVTFNDPVKIKNKRIKSLAGTARYVADSINSFKNYIHLNVDDIKNEQRFIITVHRL